MKTYVFRLYTPDHQEVAGYTRKIQAKSEREAWEKLGEAEEPDGHYWCL